MKTSHTTLSVVIASTLLAAFAPSAHADDSVLLYEQKFNTTSDSNVVIGSASTSTQGWMGRFGSTASTTALGSRVYVAPGNGNPSTDGAGYLAFTPGATSGADDKIFTATTLFSTPLDLKDATFSWTMGNSLATPTVQVLVLIDGNWFASSRIYQTAAMNAATFASTPTADLLKTFDFSTDKEEWRAFTLQTETGEGAPPTSISLGALLSEDLTSTLVSGVGFYVTFPSTATSGTTRIDSFTITAPVPEPGSAALLLGLGAMAWTVCRRSGRR